MRRREGEGDRGREGDRTTMVVGVLVIVLVVPVVVCIVVDMVVVMVFFIFFSLFREGTVASVVICVVHIIVVVEIIILGSLKHLFVMSASQACHARAPPESDGHTTREPQTDTDGTICSILKYHATTSFV